MHDAWIAFLQDAANCWIILKSTKSEVWAAWFQAVGSVGAIIAAIIISRHQASLARALAREEFDRQSEAVSSFTTVQQINIRNEMRRIRTVIGDNEANLGILAKDGADAALANLLFASTGLDSYVLSNANSLPREARLAFPQLIAMKEMYNAIMRELYEKMERSKDLDLAAVNNTAQKLLGSIDRLLAEIRESAGTTNDLAVRELRAQNEKVVGKADP
jgi:hypothetical protein